jgi:hypothetical protein
MPWLDNAPQLICDWTLLHSTRLDPCTWSIQIITQPENLQVSSQQPSPILPANNYRQVWPGASFTYVAHTLFGTDVS